ncbi:putative hypothetical protein [Streptomyces sp. NBRC 110611]|nr:putative hypothetical protein [Streptomyces sp. NBRC 110611]
MTLGPEDAPSSSRLVDRTPHGTRATAVDRIGTIRKAMVSAHNQANATIRSGAPAPQSHRAASCSARCCVSRSAKKWAPAVATTIPVIICTE